MVIALNAEGIAGADSLGRRGENDSQSARGQQSESYVTHENLSSTAVACPLVP
jgi:hypothetical protein